MKKLNCILLIDDNPADNRYHQLLIQEMNITNTILVAENGFEALDLLKSKDQLLPDLIFLDINMPRMNGWEFLEAYKNLSPDRKAKIIIIMLSTSANPNDISKSQEIREVSNFETKPLTKEAIENILDKYF